MKFSFRPSQSGKARDEGRGDYSPIPDDSDSSPRESHELAEDVTQAVTPSGSQPGPSGQSRSRKLEKPKNLRARADKKREEREELREQAQKADEQGESSLAKTLRKLAKKCWNAMKRFNWKAANLFFKGGWWRVGPRTVEYMSGFSWPASLELGTAISRSCLHRLSI